jgi:hypothetical protein
LRWQQLSRRIFISRCCFSSRFHAHDRFVGNIIFICFDDPWWLTLDVVYDRHYRLCSLAALFFAFTICPDQHMLPVLGHRQQPHLCQRSVCGTRFCHDPATFSQVKYRQYAVAKHGAVAFVLVRAAYSLAPLRLRAAGGDYQPKRNHRHPTEGFPAGRRTHVITPIKAPLGLKETVQHRWHKNGRLVWASPFI